MLRTCDVAVYRCVLEVHAIAAKKEEGSGEFAVAMTAGERQRFLQGIKAKPSEYYTMLGTVNAERSDCSRPADRVSIHDGIRGSVGFARLSRMVFMVLEEWMEGQLRQQAESCIHEGEETKAMEWKETLGRVMSDQGRHDEALAMQEIVLEFRRRVLPADNPSIGEGRVWGVLRGECGECCCACSFGGCYAALMRLICRHGHEQSWFVIQLPRKALGSACDAGERAGVQGSRAACGPS